MMVDAGQLRLDTVSQANHRPTQTMDLQKAEQAISNAIYAAMAWLILDFGLLFQEHGGQTLSVLASRPEMTAGAIIAVVCIIGLSFKSRLAAIFLFLIFLLPLILRMVQGVFPSTMFLFVSLILLYFFLAAVIGTFSYHELKAPTKDISKTD